MSRTCTAMLAAVAAALVAGCLSEGRPREDRRQACVAHLRMLTLAIRMYASDNDECLPPASRWVTDTRPYLRDQTTYACPAARRLSVGYAYSSDLDATPLWLVRRAEETPGLAESNLGGDNPNALLSLDRLPQRHGRGAHASYLDGHVKWIAPAGWL